MKKLQQICAVIILGVTFVVPAFAGDMGCPGAPYAVTSEATSAGVNPLAEMALGFLLNLSSLL